LKASAPALNVSAPALKASALAQKASALAQKVSALAQKVSALAQKVSAPALGREQGTSTGSRRESRERGQRCSDDTSCLFLMATKVERFFEINKSGEKKYAVKNANEC
jgi:hypothetical protein